MTSNDTNQPMPDSTTHDSDSSEKPVTATGERSTSIEKDENDGLLPTPTPADDGAPAA
ncbi:hypothetical protein IWX78_002324 [Mycetocola sp. CAN_C7]|uniref:hypothetical protein n=1 Tax=Mycetocola sp. CAN_C7 TaxID=2787724 RepID=UPI0018CBB705